MKIGLLNRKQQKERDLKERLLERKRFEGKSKMLNNAATNSFMNFKFAVSMVGFCKKSTTLLKWQHVLPIKGSVFKVDSSQSFLHQWHIAWHLSPFQVALGNTSANAVKVTVEGWPTCSSTCLTFPLHSHISNAKQEDSGYHI